MRPEYRPSKAVFPYSLIMFSMGLGVVIIILLSLKSGAFSLSWATLGQILWPSPSPLPEAELASATAIVWTLRLPRTLMASLVGAILALAGATLQGLLRNPLAAPSMIGISSGAALCAAASIVLQQSFSAWLAAFCGPWLLPIAAFAGSLLSTLWVFSVARQGSRTDTGLLLLAGIAINSLCGAGTGFLTFFADDAQLRNITFWSLGSVAGADWQQVACLVIFSLPALITLPLMGRTLNALLLGESEAQYLGIPVEIHKRWMIIIISLAVGCAVAFTGVIGFVGLIVPHLLRLWIGSDYRRLLPASCLLGAALLASADLLARTLVAPIELPIGVVTAALGSPYFLYLLRNYQRGL